jgi:hypothetical protein
LIDATRSGGRWSHHDTSVNVKSYAGERQLLRTAGNSLTAAAARRGFAFICARLRQKGECRF